MTADRIAQIEDRLAERYGGITTPPEGDEVAADLRYLIDRLRAVEADLAQARATNARLNRRAQQAESAAAQTVEDCRRQGVSLGRGLALWAAERAEAELRMRELHHFEEEKLRAEAEAERDDLAQRLSHLLCDLTGGLLSKTNYDVQTMAQAIAEQAEKDYAPDQAELDRLAAQVQRVREVIGRVDETKSATIMVSAVRRALDGEP